MPSASPATRTRPSPRRPVTRCFRRHLYAGTRERDRDASADDGTTDGSNVNIGSASSATSQQWILTSVLGNIYKLVPVSAPGQCLDVDGQLTASGTNVQTWQYLAQANQKWSSLPYRAAIR